MKWFYVRMRTFQPTSRPFWPSLIICGCFYNEDHKAQRFLDKRVERSIASALKHDGFIR
jgi:hypothetical protein